MLYSTYLVNLQSLFLLTIFTIISFLDINRKDSFEKKIFLICNFLTFLSFFNFFLIIIPIDDVSQISKILQLSLIIISLSYFLLCLINFNFVRLRLLYIPYVLLFYVVTSISLLINSQTSYSGNLLFSNKLLLSHILFSLLSYSNLFSDFC